jgi:hypothetical protein
LPASSSSSSHPLSPISPSLPPAPLPSSLSLSSIWEARGLVRAGGRDLVGGRRSYRRDDHHDRRGGRGPGAALHGRRGVASPNRVAQSWPGTAWGPTPRRTGLPYPSGSPSPWVVVGWPVTLGREGGGPARYRKGRGAGGRG